MNRSKHGCRRSGRRRKAIPANPASPETRAAPPPPGSIPRWLRRPAGCGSSMISAIQSNRPTTKAGKMLTRYAVQNLTGRHGHFHPAPLEPGRDRQDQQQHRRISQTRAQDRKHRKPLHDAPGAEFHLSGSDLPGFRSRSDMPREAGVDPRGVVPLRPRFHPSKKSSQSVEPFCEAEDLSALGHCHPVLRQHRRANILRSAVLLFFGGLGMFLSVGLNLLARSRVLSMKRVDPPILASQWKPRFPQSGVSALMGPQNPSTPPRYAARGLKIPDLLKSRFNNPSNWSDRPSLRPCLRPSPSGPS